MRPEYFAWFSEAFWQLDARYGDPGGIEVAGLTMYRYVCLI